MLESRQRPLRTRRALLLFADSLQTSCARKGWPAAFQSLLAAAHLSFESFEAAEPFDFHLFTSPGGSRPTHSCQIHVQQGTSFGEKLENAIATLARLDYREIVVVGQDCPDLEPADIRRAFELLDHHKLVLGPDHRGGCYLIGIHASDRSKLRGVQWQKNTDFQALRRRFGVENACQLAVKMDLDTWADVRLLAASASRWRNLAAFLLLSQSSNGRTVSIAKKRDPIL
ncbi:MAG: DUF2064 domain-containing protein, partial [Acidobacteria bacterium]|nr:DUF2064 domain-containing protein [Acidobacteriota bacterium]